MHSRSGAKGGKREQASSKREEQRATPFPCLFLFLPARSLPQRCPISCAFYLVLRYEELAICSLPRPSATPASPSSGVRGAIALFYPHRCVLCILPRWTTPHPLIRGQRLSSPLSHDGFTRPSLSPRASIARPPPLMSVPQGMLAHEHINHISCIRHMPARLAARVRFSSAACTPAGALRIPPACSDRRRTSLHHPNLVSCPCRLSAPTGRVSVRTSARIREDARARP
jgi:hypothetical protein